LPILKQEFCKKGVTTPVIAAEDMNFTENLVTASLADSSASAALSIVGVHQYGSLSSANYGAAYLNATKAAGKRLWMTETSDGAANDPSITDGLIWASMLHYDLTVAQVNAFCYWWLWDSGTSKGALITTDPSSGAVKTVNKRLYAIGQYSRYIRPGWRQIKTSNSGSLLASAYQSADGAKEAIVVINAGPSAETLAISLLGKRFTRVTVTRTSATESLSAVGSFTAGSSSFSYNIPAKSVTSFYASVE
jgi:O-glycosyl hydrolase